MVKSGLVNRPSVSHFRLALHLSTALFLFGYILWTALPILYPYKKQQYYYSSLNKILKYILGVVSLQIIFGTFTAGLKAGFIFNTYPKMGNNWLPSTASNVLKNTGLISLVENPILVQFIHRWLGATILILILIYFIKSKKYELNKIQKKCNDFLLAMVVLQFTLGIFTLINAVPVSLGVLHQLGAVILLSIIIITLYFFKQKKTNLNY